MQDIELSVVGGSLKDKEEQGKEGKIEKQGK